MKIFTKEDDLKSLQNRLEEIVSEITKRVEKENLEPYMADFVIDSATRIVADFLKWQLMTGIIIKFDFFE